MKALLAALLALVVAAAMAGDADARSGKKKKKKYRSYDAPYAQPYHGRRLYSGYEDGSYFERRLDKVPFGSPRWWQVYEELNLPNR